MPSLAVKWTPNALQGIEKAYNFLIAKDQHAAQAAVHAIRKNAALLQNFPQIGKPAADLEPEYRELLIPFGGSGYVILYAVLEEYILVLAVKHQKEVGY